MKVYLGLVAERKLSRAESYLAISTATKMFSCFFTAPPILRIFRSTTRTCSVATDLIRFPAKGDARDAPRSRIFSCAFPEIFRGGSPYPFFVRLTESDALPSRGRAGCGAVGKTNHFHALFTRCSKRGEKKKGEREREGKKERKVTARNLR